MPRLRRSLPARKPTGAREAGYVLLRLPLEVRDIFVEWLHEHYPDKLKHVLSLMRSAREGKLYDPSFGARMTGSGPYAWMIGRRFEVAAARLGLSRSRIPLRCDLFRPPARRGEQLRSALRGRAKLGDVSCVGWPPPYACCDAWNAPVASDGIDARNPVCDHLSPIEVAFAGG